MGNLWSDCEYLLGILELDIGNEQVKDVFRLGRENYIGKVRKYDKGKDIQKEKIIKRLKY